jgi:hypothetical protein
VIIAIGDMNGLSGVERCGSRAVDKLNVWIEWFKRGSKNGVVFEVGIRE